MKTIMEVEVRSLINALKSQSLEGRSVKKSRRSTRQSISSQHERVKKLNSK